MPPIIKSDKEEIDEIIDKASERFVEKATPKIADSILEKMNAGGKPSSKLSQVLENLRKKEGKEGEPPSQTDTETEKEKIEKEQIEKEKAEKGHEHEHSHEEEVPCPLCSSKEHTHKLKSFEPGKVKCTGDKCGVEYALIPTVSEYKCETCGLPHKKPVESTVDDKCPFCNGETFAKFDWSKLKNKKK